MKKLALTIFLMSFNALSSPIFSEFECGKYDEGKALELDPDKSYFDDPIRRGPLPKKVQDSEIYEFHQHFELNERQLLIVSNPVIAADANAPLAYTMTFYRDRWKYASAPEGHLTIQDVIPHVIYRTPFGVLAGDNRGEFGGELVFFDLENKVSILADLNVEDIYKFPFGYVITEGISHMSSDRGNLYIITFSKSNPVINKLYGLIGAPIASYKTKPNELLIKSKGGYQLLDDAGKLSRVVCSKL
ncbi:hypothetical protein [Thalassotalea aquiviva]|uniref:hypothetical protein n=1 Tax=Thalassotalea aquiviva TaxID=3242415 RepID=UPI00352A1605